MGAVKFARSVTSQEALVSRDKDVIYFTPDDASIIMGGVAYGKDLVGEEKREFLGKLYDKHLENLVTLSASSSKSLVGPSTEVTITVLLKDSGVPCSADSVPTGDGFLTGCEFTESTPGTYTTKVKMVYPGKYNSKITIIYSGITKTAGIEVSCFSNVLYGWSPSETINSISDLRDGSSYGPADEFSGDYTISIKDEGYMYFLIPESTTNKSSLEKLFGLENGIPVYFTKQVTPVVSGYTVYRNTDKQAASSHTITFS